jgi:hypothetical protein
VQSVSSAWCTMPFLFDMLLLKECTL